MKNLVIKGFILAAILPISAIAQLDPVSIQKIRTEGMEKSQVMDIAFNLTDKSGNRRRSRKKSRFKKEKRQTKERS